MSYPVQSAASSASGGSPDWMLDFERLPANSKLKTKHSKLNPSIGGPGGQKFFAVEKSA
jgi:hypothetical protein